MKNEDCMLSLSLALAKILAEDRSNAEISLITCFLSDIISNLNLIARSRALERRQNSGDSGNNGDSDD